MGIGDQIRRAFGIDGSPAELLRAHPALLLPQDATPEQVSALVHAWNPQAKPDEHGVLQVAEAVWWHGPFDLEEETIRAAQLPSEFATGYVARCRRSRMWRTRMSRRMLGVPDDITREYPAGVPAHAEGEAWDLVRALARALGGMALLPGNPAYLPNPEDRPSVFLYSPQHMSATELREVLEPIVPGLGLDGEEYPDTYIVIQRDGDYTVDVDVTNPDYDRPPYAVRHLGEGVVSYDLTAPDPGLEGADLERAVAQALHQRIGGIVLDEYGLPLPGIVPGQPEAANPTDVG